MSNTNSPQDVIDRERKIWRSVSAGWRKNDSQLRDNSDIVSQRMLERANIGSGNWVLDIASGTTWIAHATK